MSVIRDLNDRFRTTFDKSLGKTMMTNTVNALDPQLKLRICREVQKFNKFDDANDPYHEHDFGAFDIDGHKIFWKIDYYNKTLDAGSEDPADTSKTTRVLTIFFANEY